MSDASWGKGLALLLGALLVASTWAAPGGDRRFDRNMELLDESLLEEGIRGMLAEYREQRRQVNARNWRRAAHAGSDAVDCAWDDAYLAWAGIDTPAEVIFARALVTNRGRGAVDLGFGDFAMQAAGQCPDAIEDGPVTVWIHWNQLSSAMEPAEVSNLEEARRMYEQSAIDTRMKLILKLEGELQGGQPHGRFALTQINHMPEGPNMPNPGSVNTKAMGYADFEAGELVRRLTVTEMLGNSTLVYLEQPHGDEHQFVYWIMASPHFQMGDWYTVNRRGELDGWFHRYRSNENPQQARVCLQNNFPAPRDACGES